jgi:hypothetical protein
VLTVDSKPLSLTVLCVCLVPISSKPRADHSSTRKRRLKTFEEFIGSKGLQRKRLGLREPENQSDATAELQYDVVGLPKDIPHSEKMPRISAFADTITNIQDSDVFLFSLWHF